MKTLFLYWKTVLIALLVVTDVVAQTPDVQTGNPYVAITDWAKTYNTGSYNEVIFSNTGASESSREGCDVNSVKSTTISLTSSDTQWLDVNVPFGGSSTIAKIVFMVVGNSTSTSGWDHQVWASESVPFDVTKATPVAFHFYGYKSGFCTPFDLSMPAGTKSVRIYRRIKTTDNGDGTFSLSSSTGTNTGSGQTMNFHFFDVYLVTGPKIIDLSLASVAADAINHSAKTIHVTVPFATNITSLVPTFTFAAGTSLVDPLDATTAKDFSSPVPYAVTDGNKTEVYTVSVSKTPASILCNIESFTVPIQVANSQFIPAAGLAKDSIIVTVPYSTSPATIAALTPTYTPSPLVSATAPASGVTQDFTNPVSYVVTAEDVTVSKEYIVRVKKAPASVKCVIDSLKGFAAKEQISFNPSTLTYDIVVPSASNLSSLSPQIFFSPLSSNTGIPTDYTTAQTIVVTAEDGLATKTYTINVTKDNTPPSLLSSKPANGAIDYSLAGLMSLKYSEPIDLGTKALSISGGGVLGTVSIIDSVAKFSFSNLTKLTTYTVTIPDSAFQDKLGNYCAASSFSFTTANDVFLKVDSVYASHMTAESYDLPAFITGSDFNIVKYDPTADVKATTTTQHGAYVIPAGEKLIIKAEQVGSVLASIYATGGNRTYTITSNADPLISSGSFANYDNNGDTLSWIPTSVITTNPTEIYITNTSAAGDIYVPYIYINALGSTVVNEQSMYCTSVAP